MTDLAKLFPSAIPAKVHGSFTGCRIQIGPVGVMTGCAREHASNIKGKIRRNDKRRLDINHMGVTGEFMAAGANFSDRFPHNPPAFYTYGGMAIFAAHIIPQKKIMRVTLRRQYGFR